MVKHLLILPVLAAFIMAFNTETVYTLEDTPADFVAAQGKKAIELIIDKNTTDKELSEIREKLSKDQIDFSYTAVRNGDGQIIHLAVSLKGVNREGKSFSGSYESDSGTPIEPLLISFDDARNRVVFTSAHSGDAEGHLHKVQAKEMVWVKSTDEKDGGEIHKKIVVRSLGEGAGNSMVWNSDDEGHAQHIEIRKVEGDTVILINGKKAGQTEWEELDKSGELHKIKVSKMVNSGGRHVMVISDSDDEADIHVLDGASGGFFFIDSGKGEKPLFYIDGKKASDKEVKALKPDSIDKIEVIKGEKAIEEYGRQAKDGVVLITTKK